MGWRSVIISNPARLSLVARALRIQQGNNEALVPIEDVSVVILDHSQITLTAALFSEIAEAQIVLLTVNASHLPIGVFLPYLPHSRALKVMLAQLAISVPVKKRLWQSIVYRKITNQANVLLELGHIDSHRRLTQLANDLR